MPWDGHQGSVVGNPRASDLSTAPLQAADDPEGEQDRPAGGHPAHRTCLSVWRTACWQRAMAGLGKQKRCLCSPAWPAGALTAYDPKWPLCPGPGPSYLVTSWSHRAPSFCDTSSLLWANNIGNIHQKLYQKGWWTGLMAGGFQPCRKVGWALGLAAAAAPGLGGLETVSPGHFPGELSGRWVRSVHGWCGPSDVVITRKRGAEGGLEPPQTTRSARVAEEVWAPHSAPHVPHPMLHQITVVTAEPHCPHLCYRVALERQTPFRSEEPAAQLWPQFLGCWSRFYPKEH